MKPARRSQKKAKSKVKDGVLIIAIPKKTSTDGNKKITVKVS